jgi:hypothetical protein
MAEKPEEYNIQGDRKLSVIFDCEIRLLFISDASLLNLIGTMPMLHQDVLCLRLSSADGGEGINSSVGGRLDIDSKWRTTL